MEDNNKQSFSQGLSSQPRPRLVGIIVGIAFLFGISIIATMIMFIGIAPGRILETLISIKTVITITLILGGFGVLYMKKWGLYLFSVAILILVGNTLYDSWPVWGMWRWPAIGMRAFIIVVVITLYGIISLVYLWSIRNRFK